MSDTGVWLRLTGALGALALGVGAVAIVVVLAHRTPGPTDTSSSSAPIAAPATGETDTAAFPAPPPGAGTCSRSDGSDVIALGVVPGRKLKLRASVLGGQGGGVGGLNVSFRVGGRKATGVPCGAGCYDASVKSASTPKVVEVAVKRDSGTTTWRVPMPRACQPADAAGRAAG